MKINFKKIIWGPVLTLLMMLGGSSAEISERKINAAEQQGPSITLHVHAQQGMNETYQMNQQPKDQGPALSHIKFTVTKILPAKGQAINTMSVDDPQSYRTTKHVYHGVTNEEGQVTIDVDRHANQNRVMYYLIQQDQLIGGVGIMKPFIISVPFNNELNVQLYPKVSLESTMGADQTVVTAHDQQTPKQTTIFAGKMLQLVNKTIFSPSQIATDPQGEQVIGSYQLQLNLPQGEHYLTKQGIQITAPDGTPLVSSHFRARQQRNRDGSTGVTITINSAGQLFIAQHMQDQNGKAVDSTQVGAQAVAGTIKTTVNVKVADNFSEGILQNGLETQVINAYGVDLSTKALPLTTLPGNQDEKLTHGTGATVYLGGFQVKKLDQHGKPLREAQFALAKTAEDAKAHRFLASNGQSYQAKLNKQGQLIADQLPAGVKFLTQKTDQNGVVHFGGLALTDTADDQGHGLDDQTTGTDYYVVGFEPADGKLTTELPQKVTALLTPPMVEYRSRVFELPFTGGIGQPLLWGGIGVFASLSWWFRFRHYRINA